MLTVKEVAALLKLNPVTVRRWVHAGKIRAVKLGSDTAGWRIAESEVRRLLGQESAEGTRISGKDATPPRAGSESAEGTL